MFLLVLVVCNSTWAQAGRSVSIPAVQTIAQGIVSRTSANKDDAPPWKQITIENIFEFKRKPRVRDRVTVITIDSDISPLDLRILKARQVENQCDESLPRWWEIELEPVTQKKFFDAAPPPDRNAFYPFDVVILYPAVRTARQIKKDQLKSAMLPKGTVINTVKAAIDLNDDRTPDVVVLEYCCLHNEQRVNECDYTCGKIFKKVGNAWRLVDTSAPC